MNKPTEVRVNLAFRGRQLTDFMALKDYLGIQANADVVRYLVRRHARALRRREKRLAQSGSRSVRGDVEARREGHLVEQGAVRGDAQVSHGQRSPALGERVGDAGAEFICLDCPLPECDERDPRCLYRRALREREDQS